MTLLSDSLTDLAHKVREAAALSAAAELTSAEKAIEAGAFLCEAKNQCGHGEWLPFLKRAEVHERQARRLMQLSRSGLNGTSVSDLGGIKATLDWMKGFRLPLPHEVLLVSLDDFEPGENKPAAYVWWTKAGYHVVMFDLNEVTPHTKFTQKPVQTELGVRLSIYQLLDHRYAEMTFQVVNENPHKRELDSLFAIADRSRRKHD